MNGNTNDKDTNVYVHSTKDRTQRKIGATNEINLIMTLFL